MPDQTAEVQTLFPIALSVLAVGAVVPCELWLRHADQATPVLYRSRNLPFTAAHRQRLIETGVETIWVPFSDSELWTRYLEAWMRERVADQTRPVAERAEILITTSRSVMKEVLANPRDAHTKERVTNVAESICELMRQPSAIAAAVRLMEHDYYTYTHCLHVALFSVALARSTGIDADDALAEIGRGALLHDCGKVQLPPALLNKSGPYTEREWCMMILHPAYGRQILQETGWASPLLEDIVYTHHERLDGSGYPEALVGAQVSAAARLAAIADAFDAMTTDRSYQRALTAAQALRVLRVTQRAGYDQQLTEAFIRLLAKPS